MLKERIINVAKASIKEFLVSMVLRVYRATEAEYGSVAMIVESHIEYDEQQYG